MRRHRKGGTFAAATATTDHRSRPEVRPDRPSSDTWGLDVTENGKLGQEVDHRGRARISKYARELILLAESAMEIQGVAAASGGDRRLAVWV